jgi:transposase
VERHVVIRYSEAFKLQIVRELERGQFENATAAGRAYGVNGKGTVAKWVRQFGKDHLLGKLVRVMKADEETEVKALRKRVRELERALADAHIDLKLEAAYLELACEEAGVKKKTRWGAVNKAVEGETHRFTVSELCTRTGMSRQNYYAARRLRHCRQINEELILAFGAIEK